MIVVVHVHTLRGKGARGAVGGWCGGDTAGAGRRSGRIPPPHESETASATNRSAVESPRLHLASAGVAGRAKTAIAPSRAGLPGNEAPRATSHGEIANNRWRPLNDSFHLLKRQSAMAC